MAQVDGTRCVAVLPCWQGVLPCCRVAVLPCRRDVKVCCRVWWPGGGTSLGNSGFGIRDSGFDSGGFGWRFCAADSDSGAVAVAAALRRRQVDANGDGLLSLHELRAWLELNGEESLGNSLFSALDTDGDGVMTLEEFSEGFEQVIKHKKDTLRSTEHVFPLLSVRLAWLRRFAESCKGKKYTWTARDYLKAEHGGGKDDVLQINVDNLSEHRERTNAAGKDGDGKPTNVQYTEIPFELMTTNDVCFDIVKPETEHVRTSYVELLKSTEPAEVKSATAFVSHAWKYIFVNVVDALSRLSEDTFVWFDVFTVNQHASSQVPPDWWFTTFEEAVASINTPC